MGNRGTGVWGTGSMGHMGKGSGQWGRGEVQGKGAMGYTGYGPHGEWNL